MENKQDLIFEIGGNVGTIGSSDLQGVGLTGHGQ